MALTIGEAIFVDPRFAAVAPPAAYREVLAHEVVHVLQNRLAALDTSPATACFSTVDDATEREARALGRRLAAGEAICVSARPRALVQCVTMDSLKGLLGASVYNEVAVSIRKQTDAAVKQHAIDFCYELADVFTELQGYVTAANPARGSLATIATYIVERRRSKSTSLIAKDVAGIGEWMKEMKLAFANIGAYVHPLRTR